MSFFHIVTSKIPALIGSSISLSLPPDFALTLGLARYNKGLVKTKIIFITGGVLSSLGKGVAAAAIGALLESRGLRITFQKLDPYINVDPGTMNPFQHGEVYVTEDGAETDLDLGHYERYTSVTLGQEHNFTSGRIYHNFITKERRGGQDQTDPAQRQGIALHRHPA